MSDAERVEVKSVWDSARRLIHNFRLSQLLVVIVLAVLYGVYHLNTQNDAFTRNAKVGWDKLFNKKKIREHEKLISVNQEMLEILGRATQISDYSNTISDDVAFVRDEFYEILPLYSAIDTSSETIRNRVSYHHNIAEMKIVQVSLEGNITHADEVEKHVLLAYELMQSPLNTEDDFTFYSENDMYSSLKQHEFVASALRQVYAPNEENHEALQESLRAFGGCNALIKKDIKLKAVFQATQCPVP